MPDAHFERERIGLVHVLELFHELEHVLHGDLRQAPYIHELTGTGFGEAWDGTGSDPVEITHGCLPSGVTAWSFWDMESGFGPAAGRSRRSGRCRPRRQGRGRGRTGRASPDPAARTARPAVLAWAGR